MHVDLLVYTCSPKYREHKQKELGFTNLTIKLVGWKYAILGDINVVIE